MRSNKFKLFFYIEDQIRPILLIYQNNLPVISKFYITKDDNKQNYISSLINSSSKLIISNLLKKKKTGELTKLVGGSVIFDDAMLKIYKDKVERRIPNIRGVKTQRSVNNSWSIGILGSSFSIEISLDNYIFIAYILENGKFYGNMKKKLKQLYE